VAVRSCFANSFDYLTELQRHAQEVATTPAEWMPWNYRETLERTVPLSDSA
jgi:transposase